jgi:hypothetical protein
LATGSTLEIFKYVKENYKNNDSIINNTYLFCFLRNAMLNEENGLEISKYIFDSVYTSNSYFHFTKDFVREIVGNVTDEDFLRFMFDKKSEFEIISEFNFFIKNKNYILCKIYLNKYEFLINYSKDFLKHKAELNISSISS